MLIERNNFTHSPPWKYAVRCQRRFKASRSKTGWCYYWQYAYGNRGNNGSRYRTIKAAMQASEAFKKLPGIFKVRIEHVYYGI